MTTDQIESASAFRHSEMNPDAGLRPWLNWINAVERMVGHSLDGDGTTDGYSLDQCGDWFDAGWTPERAAAAIAKAVQS